MGCGAGTQSLGQPGHEVQWLWVTHKEGLRGFYTETRKSVGTPSSAGMSLKSPSLPFTPQLLHREGKMSA